MAERKSQICSERVKQQVVKVMGVCVCVFVCMSAGCMMWRPQWPDVSTASPRMDAQRLLDTMEQRL